VLLELAMSGLSRLSAGSTRRIVICGHSLGAGVAALLSALWRDRGLEGVDVQCIALACPQVLDASLAVAQRGHTTSIVVGNDLVPRFSLATSQDLQAAILCLDDPERQGLQPALGTDAVLEAQAQGDSDRLAVSHAVVRPLVCTAPGRLFPAGRLIHLLPGREPLAIGCEDVDELRIAQDMASSHLPRRYLEAVQRAVALQPRL